MVSFDEGYLCSLQAWQRPTLPRLKTKYHWRWGDLRPSSRWDRVWTPRQSHQAGEEQRDEHIGFLLARMGQGPSALFCWREWGKCPDRAVAFREWGMCPKRCKSFSIYQVSGWTMIMRAIKPIERLVPVSYAHCCVSTPGLSTWSSSTVLKGELVSRWVSRLDAFSGYPVHT